MVKMSETIICQRFIQNAWKKDLCSNCFKSKEDHVTLPEKRIIYQWTSHVNNFPQHGILKDGDRTAKTKLRTVSFQTNDTEIIGFGGEEYSSDDEVYLSVNEETAITDTDNEEEEKEFRKLTQSNTNFNSITTNLQYEKPVDTQPHNSYSYFNLKLGKPLTDADGRRRTLQVSIEPFHNSVVVSSTLAEDRGVHHNKISPVSCPVNNQKTDDENTNDIDIINNNDNNNNSYTDVDISNSNIISNSICDTTKCSKDDLILKGIHRTVCDRKVNILDKNSVGTLNDSTTENVDVKSMNVGLYTKEDTERKMENEKKNEDADAKYVKVSNVFVTEPKSGEKKLLENGGKVAEKIRNAKNILEPLFSKLKTKTHEDEKLDISNGYQESASCNDICEKEDLAETSSLPSAASKELDIEFNKPESREMVGEPDGKADSDDSSERLVTPDLIETVNSSTFIESAVSTNPQHSFLHAFSKEKPKLAVKPVISSEMESTPRKITKKDIDVYMTNCGTTTPKTPISLSTSGFTKRQAPKPPSPKSTPTLTAAMMVPSVPIVDDLEFTESKISKCESPLINGSRNAVNFLGENEPAIVKRRLNLEPTTSVDTFSRNSLNLFLISSAGSDSMNSSATISGLCYDEELLSRAEEKDATSLNSAEVMNCNRSAIKCNRSLSCDSIITPKSRNLRTLPFSEKSRKYSGATIKVKSTIRKFLRFNSRDDEKLEQDTSTQILPRRRIEIIHPLDLNNSSIEILRSVPANGVSTNNECIKGVTIQCSESANVINCGTCPTGRPNKPPPPPRAQSLDQKLISEISRPVRPPPPKSVHLKQPSPKLTSACVTSNVYENLGESRQGIVPAKPQRASSMRDRTRPIIIKNEENTTSLVSESEAAPECDRNGKHQMSDFYEKMSTFTMTYSGSETESDLCYQSVSLSGPMSSFSETSNVLTIEPELRTNKSVVYNSLEDNYSAVIIANHEALSQLLEQVNQTTLVPNSLKTLQTTLNIQFNQFKIDESSKIVVADWNFYNATWNFQNVVLSLSTKHLGPMKTLPSWITLFPLVKFSDIVPSRFLKEIPTSAEINAHITVWNEERIETIQTYCQTHETVTTFSESGLLLTQLTNALKYLQACGIEDISLDEIFVCRRKSDVESKLLLLPINIDHGSTFKQNEDKIRISLCKCVSNIADMLLPKQQITETIKRILSDEKAVSLSQARSVTEYWLWGPYNVNLSNDRQTLLQRWLDLERATYLHRMVCKKPNELSLNEICHVMFLVRTNAKTLTEASYLLEKPVL